MPQSLYEQIGRPAGPDPEEEKSLESYRIDPTGAKIGAPEPQHIKALRMLFGLAGGNDPNTATLAPAALGLSLKNPKNVAKIIQMMKKISPQLSADIPEEAREGASFMMAKYPKFSRLTQGEFAPMKGTAVGGYDPGTNKAVVDMNLKAPETVNTIAHESAHGWQNKRGQVDFNKYITPEKDVLGYWNQPAEVNARKAGGTAEGTYNKFYELLMKMMEQKHGGTIE